MKNPIMKMFILRKLAVSIFTLLALTGAAHAQAGDATMLRDKDAAEGKAVHEYIDRLQTDEKYRETIRSQQAAPTSNDPWGSVRPTATLAKPAVKPAAVAAKPAAGSAKTATGSGKPAIGAAASATSATPKGQ